MEKDGTELVIEHGDNGPGSGTEGYEVDISVNTDQVGQDDQENQTNQKDQTDQESQIEEKEEIHDSSTLDFLDDIQAKLASYPLPTKEVGEMSPPSPPPTRSNSA